MRELFGDESVRGIELAVTPVVFGGIGWLVDSWLGTGPWLAIGLGTFAVLGTIAKMWFGYDAHMRELEATGRWARRHAGAEAPEAEVERDLWAERRAQA